MAARLVCFALLAVGAFAAIGNFNDDLLVVAGSPSQLYALSKSGVSRLLFNTTSKLRRDNVAASRDFFFWRECDNSTLWRASLNPPHTPEVFAINLPVAPRTSCGSIAAHDNAVFYGINKQIFRFPITKAGTQSQGTVLYNTTGIVISLSASDTTDQIAYICLPENSFSNNGIFVAPGTPNGAPRQLSTSTAIQNIILDGSYVSFNGGGLSEFCYMSVLNPPPRFSSNCWNMFMSRSISAHGTNMTYVVSHFDRYDLVQGYTAGDFFQPQPYFTGAERVLVDRRGLPATPGYVSGGVTVTTPTAPVPSTPSLPLVPVPPTPPAGTTPLPIPVATQPPVVPNGQCGSLVDVVFVLDGSHSVSKDIFESVKSQLAQAIPKLAVKNVAFVQFGSKAVPTAFSPRDAAPNVLKGIQKIAQSSEAASNIRDGLAAALNLLRSLKTSRVIVLVTDGHASVAKQKPGAAVSVEVQKDASAFGKSVSASGIDIIGIAVGKKPNTRFFTDVAGKNFIDASTSVQLIGNVGSFISDAVATRCKFPNGQPQPIPKGPDGQPVQRFRTTTRAAVTHLLFPGLRHNHH